MIGVVGIGNPLRCDDGVGPYIASAIDDMHLSGVEVMITQQLHLEFIDKFLQYDKVVIVDACVTGCDFDFYPIKKAQERRVASSHHLDVNLLSDLAKRLYGKEIDLYICSVRGENFEVGEVVSAKVLACAQKAIEVICAFVRSKDHA